MTAGENKKYNMPRSSGENFNFSNSSEKIEDSDFACFFVDGI